MTTTSLITADTRINPLRPENQAHSVTKQADGSLSVTQQSGHTFTLSPEDELFQAFTIYTILYSEARQ